MLYILGLLATSPQGFALYQHLKIIFGLVLNLLPYFFFTFCDPRAWPCPGNDLFSFRDHPLLLLLYLNLFPLLNLLLIDPIPLIFNQLLCMFPELFPPSHRTLPQIPLRNLYRSSANSAYSCCLDSNPLIFFVLE